MLGYRWLCFASWGGGDVAVAWTSVALSYMYEYLMSKLERSSRSFSDQSVSTLFHSDYRPGPI